MRAVPVAALVLSALLQLPAEPAQARCQTFEEVTSLARSVRHAVRCRLRNRAGACTPRAPRCAPTTIEETLALTFGARQPGRRPRTQLRCQRALARASSSFLTSRLYERLIGDRRQLTSQDHLLPLLAACAVSVAGTDGATLPAVGEPCAGVLGPPGSLIDPRELIACLRPALERIVDDAAPARLAPNVVLVLTDDQRPETIQYMPTVRSALRDRGVHFTNAFATTPLCCPSRASILSGRYAHNTGVLDNGGPHGGALAFDASSTVATWLSDAGYVTGLFGKYLNAYHRLAPSVPPGWTVWNAFVRDNFLFYDYVLSENGWLHAYGNSPADYSTDLLGARAVEFARAHADVPFFIYYAPFAPHAPATPAERHRGSHAGLPPWRPASFMEHDVSDKPPWVGGYQFFFYWSGAPQADYDRFHIDQIESLLAVDDAVAALLAELEALGLADNTLFVFMSDNGYSWGEHWVWGKECPYDECTRIPLLIRYPMRNPRPHREERFALNVDLAPTIAELAGVGPLTELDGRSLVPLIEGGTGPWREAILEEYWFRSLILIPTHASVRTPSWKYIEYDDGFAELYDLVDDPAELTNLAADAAYADVRATLAAQLAVLKND
jgi:arylsulfatase A-like enzyme